MSEELGGSTLPVESAKSSVLEEEKKADQESGSGAAAATIKEAPMPIINPGFRGLFSLKSKNMSAKDRFS
jgi:hypothetical protein